MAIEFTTTFGLIATIARTAKGLLDASTQVKVNEVAIQLQSVVLDLQSEMSVIQSDYQKVLRSCDDLENKLAENENWDKERTRYHLENPGGNFVYALNDSEQSKEANHWICTNCYEEKKKSILQRAPYPKWLCPRCKTEVFIHSWPGFKPS